MSSIRVDLQTADGLARGSKMLIDEEWEKVRLIGEMMCALYKQDVSVTYTLIPEGTPSELFGTFRYKEVREFDHDSNCIFEPVAIEERD